MGVIILLADEALTVVVKLPAEIPRKVFVQRHRHAR